MRQLDQIWANEAGIMVRFERATDACGAAALGYVTISIVEQATDKVLAEATLTDWRWKRAVKAMAPEGSAP